MILVDLFEVASLLPAEWKKECASVTRELEQASTDDERDRLLKDHSDLWREVKEKLSEASHGKCWYCESKNTRSDNAVDHYRPKGKVAEDANHSGYWWLAFDYQNYRYACTYCNSRRRHAESGSAGGKQDHFPLAVGSFRAYGPNDSVDCEEPLLLDPCSVLDVSIVWYDEEGKLALNTSMVLTDPLAMSRIDSSRVILHLDHPYTVRERKRIYLKIISLCKRADRIYKSILMGNPDLRIEYKEQLAELAQFMTRSAEYSAVARCAVRGFREASLTAKILCEAPL
ncbi:hypothetical protein AB0N06_35915 [Streptomyces sp. NPDC051020]|uniref:hypothetical protein n=1 Tax=Streptomyces sp. NPDC051020 TaxID=3155409 RepID=UPI0034257872